MSRELTGTAIGTASLLVRRSVSLALLVYLPTELYVLDALLPHSSFMDALGVLGIGAWGVTLLVLVACALLTAACYLVCRVMPRAWIAEPLAAAVRIVEVVALSVALILAVRAAKTYLQAVFDVSWAFRTGVKTFVLLVCVAVACYWTWGARSRARLDRVLRRIDAVALACLVVLGAAAAYTLPPRESDHPGPVRAADCRGCPDIFLVTIDAFAASRASLYGYPRATTPHLAEFGRNGLVFDSAVANANFTTAGMATLMSGRYITRTGAYEHAGPPTASSMQESLPRILKMRGYQTAAFVANPFAHPSHLGIEQEFDVAPPPLMRTLERLAFLPAQLKTRLDTTYMWYVLLSPYAEWIREFGPWGGSTPYPPQLVFDRAESFLASRSDPRPLFLWVHVMPPHDPYLPPPPFRGRFRGGDAMLRSSDQRRVPMQYGPRDAADVAVLADRYDEFLAYTDAEVGAFLERLEKQGRMAHSVVIVTSDHGESFSHGWLRHGGPDVYEPLVRIPLIVRTPNGVSGRSGQLVEQVDIVPTVADLAGAPSPAGTDGRSFASLLRGAPLAPDPAFMISDPHGSRFRAPDAGAFAVRDGSLKLIWHIRDGKVELYDLASDPDESRNLAAARPGEVERLKELINDRILRRALPGAS